MQLNKSIFLTITLIVLILFFSSSTAATPCKTVTKTRHSTKTVHPKNCPKTKTTAKTVTASATTTSTRLTTTTTTTTSTVTSIPTENSTPTKRHENYEKVICVPDNKHHIHHYKHGKCVKTVYCTPTVFLKCPKVRTKTLTITATTTSTSVTVSTTTTTAPATTTTVIPCCLPGAFQTSVPLSLHAPADITPIDAPDQTSCCVACAKDPSCAQWDFSFNRCFLMGSATCKNPVIQFGSGATAGGIMRCQDGCLSG